MASSDPWRRFNRGAELARAVERGREQDALWELDDGAAPPPDLLARALGSAAYQGMKDLCGRLVAMGASTFSRLPTGVSVREKVDSIGWGGGCYEERWPVAMLAMLGGHAGLGLEIAERHGAGALVDGSLKARDYFALCSAGRLRGAGRGSALRMARQMMSPKDRARAAGALCVAGMMDDALDLLESTEAFEQARVARAMVAPLCAYGPAETTRELALLVLERALELCDGRSGPAACPWSFRDLARLSDAESRKQAVVGLMSAGRDWPTERSERELACWPRLAAFHSQNFPALVLLGRIEPTRDELASLRSDSELVLAVLDKERPSDDLPSLWAPSGRGGLDAPKGCDARSGARAALSFAESMALGLASKEGLGRTEKERRRKAKSMLEEAPGGLRAAPRKNRL